MAMRACSIGLLTFFLMFNNLVYSLQASSVIHDIESVSSPLTVSLHNKQQTYRTAFHFQPPMNFMNDPNGPMIYKGIYHLFYQYNPYAAVWEWGNVVWAHSTSTDLINWKAHPYALKPSQPADINGCWSGSTTILLTGEPAILYTGIDSQQNQVQNLATPKNASDPYLVEWIKSPKNPLMAPTNMNKINASSFRDPTTAWLGQDGRWRVIIGSQQNRRGLVVMYRSKDFVHWIQSKRPLYSEQDTGMFECPDFFPVSTTGTSGLETSSVITVPHVKHVFKVSLDDTKHDVYTVGTYDPTRDRYVPDNGMFCKDSGLRYDYGKFYASKTFFDSAKKRRILWGWINESSGHIPNIKMGWSGVQAIPRSLWLDWKGKQLKQWPVVELEQLRAKQVNPKIKSVTKGSVHEIWGITANQADVEIKFKIKDLSKAETLDSSWTDPQSICSKKGSSVQGGIGPFGLLTFASKGLEEYTAVFFRVFKTRKYKYTVLMCSDQSRSSLEQTHDKASYGAFVDIDPRKEAISLRTLVDHSILESFGGEGKCCITARVYPVLAVDAATRLYVYNNGSQTIEVLRIKAWNMNNASIK